MSVGLSHFSWMANSWPSLDISLLQTHLPLGAKPCDSRFWGIFRVCLGKYTMVWDQIIIYHNTCLFNSLDQIISYHIVLYQNTSRWLPPIWKNIGQFGWFTQIGVKTKNIWDHHPETLFKNLRSYTSEVPKFNKIGWADFQGSFIPMEQPFIASFSSIPYEGPASFESEKFQQKVNQ